MENSTIPCWNIVLKIYNNITLKGLNFFYLQLDDSLGVAGITVLLLFACYLHDIGVKQGIVFCQQLPTFTTRNEIFKILITL
jgi:hypothetical protein